MDSDEARVLEVGVRGSRHPGRENRGVEGADGVGNLPSRVEDLG